MITEPGGPRVLALQDVPDASPGPGEVLVEVARGRGEPGRPDAAAGSLPAAAGRAGVPGPGVQRHRRGARRRGRRAGPSATRCARCCPAAGTPSWSRCRPGSCCRCRAGVALVEAGGAARGRLHGVEQRLHDWPGCGRARRCWCTAGPAASAPWRSSWPRRSARGSRSPRARPDKLERCRELGAEILVNYREQDFVEVVRDGDRRARRGRDPRQHGREVPRPATSTRSRRTAGW